MHDLGVEGKAAYAVRIRSLGDEGNGNGNSSGRGARWHHCPLPQDDAKMGKLTGAKAYTSPGYGGGVFIVAATEDEDDQACARVWRGSFDEGDGGTGGGDEGGGSALYLCHLILADRSCYVVVSSDESRDDSRMPKEADWSSLLVHGAYTV